MNEKDYKAFREWIETEFDFDESINGNRAYLYEKSIFRFACEYKHKEIEDLYKHLKHEHDLYREHLKVYEDEILEYKEAARSEAEEVNRLQDENKKLREALEFYAHVTNKYIDSGKVAKEALKEVEDTK